MKQLHVVYIVIFFIVLALLGSVFVLSSRTLPTIPTPTSSQNTVSPTSSTQTQQETIPTPSPRIQDTNSTSTTPVHHLYLSQQACEASLHTACVHVQIDCIQAGPGCGESGWQKK